MFKTNHVLSWRIVKTLIIKYGIYANIFAEKMWVYSLFFSKNTCELDIVLTWTVSIFTIKKLIKLMVLWTTGPNTFLVEKVIA